MENKVVVVGIGDSGPDSLGREALRAIEGAELLVGGDRHLGFFSSHPAEKFPIRDNLKEIVARIQTEKRRVVVLASGDPLFHGIAGYLSNKVGRDRLEILPNISSMQLAFARIKESWNDAVLVSCHAKPIEDAIDLVRDAKKVGMFTDDENTPAKVAKELLNAGIGDFRAYICENLGGADERVVQADLSELPTMTFAPLNVLILLKKAQAGTLTRKEWTFGIPEEAFFQRQPLKGLITKTEVRVISLSKMRIRPGHVVWDIGAGSGSVGVEAALLGAKVWAVEKNKDDCDIIQKNVEKFGTSEVTVVHGTAPAALSGFPAPDAVFIGGSGGEMTEIIRLSQERLKPRGRLVVNVATLENLVNLGEVTLVQVSRSRPILDLTRLEAQNPIFIIAWEKE